MHGRHRIMDAVPSHLAVREHLFAIVPNIKQVAGVEAPLLSSIRSDLGSCGRCHSILTAVNSKGECDDTPLFHHPGSSKSAVLTSDVRLCCGMQSL
ncbi:hypothetical protein IRJ41_013259 [Triplophysa rosa]|uniref:Uncharacterized protein n=1 Tax=Triplophysa rosa TaxID=992332 RepID=A0A9W7WJ20_TRIRA|nr:hypothetical protein IRJ41_013259 [Triplophysa rosa]